jgi:hypothetical protein
MVLSLRSLRVVVPSGIRWTDAPKNLDAASLDLDEVGALCSSCGMQ